jgi:hypothetical protein
VVSTYLALFVFYVAGFNRSGLRSPVRSKHFSARQTVTMFAPLPTTELHVAYMTLRICALFLFRGFVCCAVTSVNIQRQNVWWFRSDELENIWHKTVVPNRGIMPEFTWKKPEETLVYTWQLGRDLNRKPSEYICRVTSATARFVGIWKRCVSYNVYTRYGNWDTSVGIAIVWGLNYQGVGVRVPLG